MRYFFANCELNTASRTFLRDGETIPIEPQVFDLLHLLAERAGQVVSKDELIDVVWNGRIVSDATISARINAARTATGDNGKDQRVIRTVSRRGFEMVADVSNGPNDSKSANSEITQTVRYATSPDGIQIAYAVSGSGAPLMRAGHFLTHLEKDWQSPVYRPALETFSENYTLVRYDQRGTGLSQTRVDELSIEAYSNDLLAVADAAGLDRFPIFATSQGVPISVHFAASHPERVSRLVLCGGFAQGRLVRDDNYSRDEAEALMTLVKMGWGQPDSAFMSAFISMFCPDASREEKASLVESQVASATPEMAARVRLTIDQFDVADCLSIVQAPTLVIHASGDALHPISQGQLLASRIPNAEFRLVESNNHIFLKSTPAWDEIMSSTMEFLARGTS
ncbi:DNA-binding winged helix-turn-helix (wHTH) domain-containing protein [Lutimaribacter saemankumensis]|uniref:DNA-binding winged helix-turn-helix (WHTH) domain-containing protein n=2 Tax=Lutimaribacter saemankumensis TaxID=490829 RepID=A0A1G8TE50_9RHOB|nr:DNA-binding winged helix-turn-helix (wHTH) domain-containing protein [Lutimaribacter saemankumensis]